MDSAPGSCYHAAAGQLLYSAAEFCEAKKQQRQRTSGCYSGQVAYEADGGAACGLVEQPCYALPIYCAYELARGIVQFLVE